MKSLGAAHREAHTYAYFFKCRMCFGDSPSAVVEHGNDIEGCEQAAALADKKGWVALPNQGTYAPRVCPDCAGKIAKANDLKPVCSEPACSGCGGLEQKWGVRWTRGFEATGIESGWMGVSAFLWWSGTENEVIAAVKRREALDAEMHRHPPTTYHAEQFKCDRCGKTNNPAGEP